jgi:hypothetical protein
MSFGIRQKFKKLVDRLSPMLTVQRARARGTYFSRFASLVLVLVFNGKLVPYRERGRGTRKTRTSLIWRANEVPNNC